MIISFELFLGISFDRFKAVVNLLGNSFRDQV